MVPLVWSQPHVLPQIYICTYTEGKQNIRFRNFFKKKLRKGKMMLQDLLIDGKVIVTDYGAFADEEP
jgi:hypothetical protein